MSNEEFETGQVQFEFEGKWAVRKSGQWVGFARAEAEIYAAEGIAVKVLLKRKKVSTSTFGAQYGPFVDAGSAWFDMVAEFVPGVGWLPLREPTDEDGYIHWSFGQKSVSFKSNGEKVSA